MSLTNENTADLSESCLESRRIYDGRILNLRVDKVKLPNGSISCREVVEHKPAVVVIAENERSEILLISQYRYPAGKTMIELPAGIAEAGEDYAAAAERELREETGWKPARVEKIAEFYSSPGFTSELLILFYASELTKDSLPQDEDAFIIPRFASEADVRSLLASGGVKDCKTMCGLYWWLDKIRSI